MLLKIFGALPGFIYATDKLKGVYVNLFIGGSANIGNGPNRVTISQHTAYPWNGKVQINVNPAKANNFTVHVRIPGWAIGKENPFDLYNSKSKGQVTVAVNGKSFPVHVQNGYAVITRKWRAGDQISLDLPTQPRIVTPNTRVAELNNKLAVAAGPLVYAFETNNNPPLSESSIIENAVLQLQPKNGSAKGFNTIRITSSGNKQTLTAVPFYSVGNEGKASYQVWMDALH
jgi:DUF1680 family protein